ncbi:MAG: 30S ribosomal protein S13, partial [Dehalococcoidia bacterium]
MVRIAGVDVPDRKRAHVALRRIYGVGPAIASEILVKAELDPESPPRMQELSETQVDRIREIVDREYNTEGD